MGLGLTLDRLLGLQSGGGKSPTHSLSHRCVSSVVRADMRQVPSPQEGP